jgi:hypothetical protein
VLHFSGTSVLRVSVVNWNRGRKFWSIRAATVCSVIAADLLGLIFAWQPTLSWAQVPVTLKDLQGSVMEASTTHDRVVRREGRERANKYQLAWKIRFISADSIHTSTVATSYTARGTFSNKNEVTVDLARPRETKSRGGGHVLWLFEDGVLTFLRTYQGGGMKATFAVTRKGEGLDCTAKAIWPREVGVPSIMLRSFVDNKPVEVLSERQIASSCRITMDSQAPAP